MQPCLSKQEVKEMRVARLGCAEMINGGGGMGEYSTSALKNLLKNAENENCMACGMTVASHLAKICEREPYEIVRFKNLKTIFNNIYNLEPSQEDTNKYLFERLVLNMPMP
jgi:hypothetical protein